MVKNEIPYFSVHLKINVLWKSDEIESVVGEYVCRAPIKRQMTFVLL